MLTATTHKNIKLDTVYALQGSNKCIHMSGEERLREHMEEMRKERMAMKVDNERKIIATETATEKKDRDMGKANKELRRRHFFHAGGIGR